MKLGLPKGRLLDRSTVAADTAARLLAERGDSAELQTWTLRMQDIPELVGDGLLDAGITSEEWLRETGAEVTRVAPLCWYHAKICALVASGAAPTGELVRVVTEYPRIAAEFARTSQWSRFTTRTVRGAVESYIPAFADVAIECVETGESMRRNGLVVLETLFAADVWLVCSTRAAADPSAFEFLSDLASRIADSDRAGCQLRGTYDSH